MANPPVEEAITECLDKVVQGVSGKTIEPGALEGLRRRHRKYFKERFASDPNAWKTDRKFCLRSALGIGEIGRALSDVAGSAQVTDAELKSAVGVVGQYCKALISQARKQRGTDGPRFNYCPP